MKHLTIFSGLSITALKLPAILLIGLLGIDTSAIAGVLHVAAYGSDSPTCGLQSPCRSISQAMENAASGDTIYVGPGHYGDVNGDGNFAGPGDEKPDPNAGQRPFLKPPAASSASRNPCTSIRCKALPRP